MFVLKYCNSEINAVFVTNVCTQMNKILKKKFNNETMNHSFYFVVAKKINSMWGLSLPPPSLGKVHLFSGKVSSLEGVYVIYILKLTFNSGNCYLQMYTHLTSMLVVLSCLLRVGGVSLCRITNSLLRASFTCSRLRIFLCSLWISLAFLVAVNIYFRKFNF